MFKLAGETESTPIAAVPWCRLHGMVSILDLPTRRSTANSIFLGCAHQLGIPGGENLGQHLQFANRRGALRLVDDETQSIQELNGPNEKFATTSRNLLTGEVVERAPRGARTPTHRPGQPRPGQAARAVGGLVTAAPRPGTRTS